MNDPVVRKKMMCSKKEREYCGLQSTRVGKAFYESRILDPLKQEEDSGKRGKRKEVLASERRR